MWHLLEGSSWVVGALRLFSRRLNLASLTMLVMWRFTHANACALIAGNRIVIAGERNSRLLRPARTGRTIIQLLRVQLRLCTHAGGIVLIWLTQGLSLSLIVLQRNLWCPTKRVGTNIGIFRIISWNLSTPPIKRVGVVHFLNILGYERILAHLIR